MVKGHNQVADWNKRAMYNHFILHKIVLGVEVNAKDKDFKL